MLDAWGKFPSGILDGNLMSLGAFWECDDIGYDIARYCVVFDKTIGVTQIRVNISNFPQFIPTKQIDLPYIFAQYGLCVPASCDQEYLLEAFHYVQADHVVQFQLQNGSFSAVCNHPKQPGVGAQLSIALLAFFAVVGIASGAISELKKLSQQNKKYSKSKQEKVTFKKVICAFAYLNFFFFPPAEKNSHC